jgi:hypothetical protein
LSVTILNVKAQLYLSLPGIITVESGIQFYKCHETVNLETVNVCNKIKWDMSRDKQLLCRQS